eukprot:9475903-Pyramimonas_sp.AAC.1
MSASGQDPLRCWWRGASALARCLVGRALCLAWLARRKLNQVRRFAHARDRAPFVLCCSVPALERRLNQERRISHARDRALLPAATLRPLGRCDAGG